MHERGGINLCHSYFENKISPLFFDTVTDAKLEKVLCWHVSKMLKLTPKWIYLMDAFTPTMNISKYDFLCLCYKMCVCRECTECVLLCAALCLSAACSAAALPVTHLCLITDEPTGERCRTSTDGNQTSSLSLARSSVFLTHLALPRHSTQNPPALPIIISMEELSVGSLQVMIWCAGEMMRLTGRVRGIWAMLLIYSPLNNKPIPD